MGRNIDFTDQGIGKFFEPLGGGTSAVSVKAPALAADIDVLWLNALPGVTSVLTITAAGQIGTSVGGGSLDQAYDFGGAGAGRAITADTGGVSITSPLASGNVALELTQADNFACLQVTKSVGGAGSVMLLTNAGTGIGIDVVQNGAGIGIRITQNGVADAMQIVQTQDDNGLFISKAGLGGGDALVISNLGTSSGIAVDQDGDGPAISTDSAAASTIASILVVNNGTGPGERITQVGDAIGLDIAKTGAGVGQALKIDNDGTGVGFHLIQDGVARAMLIDQNANEDALRIENGGKVGIDLQHSSGSAGIIVDCFGAGSPALQLSVPGGANRVVVRATQGANASNAFELNNAGTGIGLDIDQTGNAVALEVDSEATGNPLINLLSLNANTRGDIRFQGRTSDASGPLFGDLWYNTSSERLRIQLDATHDATIASNYQARFGPIDTITIATGVANITGSHTVLAAETGVTDTMSTITPAPAQEIGDCFLFRSDTGDTITLDEAGNMKLNGSDIVLSNPNDSAVLMWSGANYIEQHRATGVTV